MRSIVEIVGIPWFSRDHCQIARSIVEFFDDGVPSCSFGRDCFVDVRGETHGTFTDHLYKALTDAGFRTFRDDDEIERGEKIKSELDKAIHRSTCSVIVLSKDYASSRWCLDELVMIIERSNTSRHIVLPVFYHVDPSHVRNQKGSFEEALTRHEERFKAETDGGEKEWMGRMKRWRAALREVSNLGGMDIKNQADGYESKFIQQIVEEVERKVNRVALELPPHLIGISSQAKDIKLWLQDGSANVDIMAICGMGGIGKTTIARYVFNLNCINFEGSSFLADIRKNWKETKGIIRLQTQLVSDISKRKKRKILSADEGIREIKNALLGKRVLLVLDDVDEPDQLKAILGMQECFYQGSKVIVTTRNRNLNKQLFKDHKIKIHEVGTLDFAKSFELFSWHAFGQDHPAEGLMEHSKRVIHKCEGLPLALEVLGSSLFGRNIDVWKSALEKLENIPNGQIVEKLKVSYDSLADEHDKKIFIWIACYFVGKHKNHVAAILDEHHMYATIGFQNLMDRCLLRVYEDRLMMHQLLQDMGREIIFRESPNEPGKRSWLWDDRDSLNVLKENTGTERVEGFVLDMHKLKEDKTIFGKNNAKRKYSEDFPGQCNSQKRRRLGYFLEPIVKKVFSNSNEMDLKIDAFTRMPNIIVLEINYLPLTGGYKEFPKKLKSLCYHGFPSKSIPSEFPLESLVALDMRNSKMQRFWDGTKVLGLLKFLNLSHCRHLTRTPNFSRLPKLERLILKDCESLVEVHDSIGNLEATLVFLNLKDCKKLRKLPRSIFMLKVLQTLILSGCSNLFGDNKTSLHAFIPGWLSKPSKPPQLSLPFCLVDLSLEGCNLSDESFPLNFSDLHSLSILNLSNNPFHSLHFVKGLTGLRNLSLMSCTSLQALTLPTRVISYDLTNCTSLETVSELPLIPQGATNERPYTTILGCPKLIEVSGLYKLEPIQNIDAKFINYLGLFDLVFAKGIEMKLYNWATDRVKKGPIQAEFRLTGGDYSIFTCNIFFPGSKIPDGFKKTKGAGVPLTVPHPDNLEIRSWILCCVYAKNSMIDRTCRLPSELDSDIFSNAFRKGEDMRFVAPPYCWGIPEADEDMTWLILGIGGLHFPSSSDELVFSVYVPSNFVVKETGIYLVYSEEDEEQMGIYDILRASNFTSNPSSRATINPFTFNPYQKDFFPEINYTSSGYLSEI